MSADDTSREALVERVVDVIVMHRASDFLGTEISIVRSLAAAIVDAVVMPLVQDWQEATRVALEAHRSAVSQRDAAIKRAEAAEAEVERMNRAYDHLGEAVRGERDLVDCTTGLQRLAAANAGKTS